MLLASSKRLRNSVFLSMLVYSPSLQAQEISVAVGVAKRNLATVEESVGEYIQERGYTEEVTGLEESIQLDGIRVPYFFLEIGYAPRRTLMPEGTIEHQIEMDWISSFLGEDTDAGIVNLSYNGMEIGNAYGIWTYKINSYTSLTYGVEYIPLNIPLSIREDLFFKGAFALRGGISYINADVNMNLSLADNKFYSLMDPSFAKEELGIAEETTLEAEIHGFGRFIHPVFTPSLQKDNFEMQLQIGVRKEIIPITIDEHLESIHVKKEKGEGELNLSGKTVGIEVKYHFPLKK